MLLQVDHNTTRFTSVLQYNYSSLVIRQTTHEQTVEAPLTSSCSYALVNNQLHRNTSEGGKLARSVFKDNLILLRGGKLSHQTFQTVQWLGCIMTEETALFTQLGNTDGWTDWDVSGFTAALLHTGESVYWRLSSKNQSCVSFIDIFQTVFLKPFNVSGQITDLLWFHISFFRSHLEFLPKQLVLGPVTYWGLCGHTEVLIGL